MDWLADILMYAGLALCVLVLVVLFGRRGRGDMESSKREGH
jgi:hypothetical protein